MRELTALAIVLLLLLSKPCLSANWLAAPSAPPVCSFLHPEEGAQRDSGMGAFLPVLPLASLRADEPLCTAMAWQAEKNPARQPVQQGPRAAFLTCFTLSPPLRGQKEAALDPLCPSGLWHLQPPHKLPAEQKPWGLSPLPAPIAGRYLSCRVARGEHSALRCVLNCAHQPAAKSLIWRVQGALRGSPGALTPGALTPGR